MILPTPDPIPKIVFAGDERMLSEMYSYRKAARDLRAKQLGKTADAEDGEDKPNAAARKGDKKKTGEKA